MNAPGRVVIIGAGPGDPGLLTARGARLLAQADVVVYDRAAEPMLRWASPNAEMIDAGGPAERDVAQDAISMLLAEKARDSLERLPELYREAFILRDLEDLSTAEVAELLGIEAAAVRQRVHRARLMLRGYLSDLMGVKP